MRSALRQFSIEDAGAVTIDWVALTAGILLLGIAVAYSVNASMENLVGQITTELSLTEVPDYGWGTASE